MNEDETIAIVLGVLVFLCGVGILYASWRNMEREERLLDIV